MIIAEMAEGKYDNSGAVMESAHDFSMGVASVNNDIGKANITNIIMKRQNQYLTCIITGLIKNILLLIYLAINHNGTIPKNSWVDIKKHRQAAEN
jgi:hypothetical protein